MASEVTPTNKNAEEEAVVKIVVFSLDQEEYATPIEDVREVLKIPEITSVPNSPDYISGIINLRGQVISVVDLEKRFQLTRDNEKVKSEHIIVADVQDSSFGIIVDKVIEVITVQAGAIQEAPDTVQGKIGSKYIKGVVVLKANSSKDIGNKEGTEDIEQEEEDKSNRKEDRILLILDISKIFDAAERKEVFSAQST